MLVANILKVAAKALNLYLWPNIGEDIKAMLVTKILKLW